MLIQQSIDQQMQFSMDRVLSTERGADINHSALYESTKSATNPNDGRSEVQIIHFPSALCQRLVHVT